MLAERAGITLEQAAAGPEPSGPSKLDLFAVNAWAEGIFAAALGQSIEARGYVDRRGLSPEMVARFSRVGCECRSNANRPAASDPISKSFNPG